MNLFLRSFFAGAAGLAGGLSIAAAANDEAVLQRAMHDELARSMTQLKLEAAKPPYFAAYRVEDTKKAEVVASFGRIVDSTREPVRTRQAIVELREGGPQLDQTNYLMRGEDAGREAPRFATDLPLDDDYAAIRRRLWLATDEAYRSAVDELARKTAALQNQARTDDTGDFTSAPVTHTEDLDPPLIYDPAATEQLARELSAVFREFPAIQTSSATLKQREVTVHYVNSEGSTFVRRRVQLVVLVEARTQATDGREVGDSIHHFAGSATGLPARAQLLAETRALARRLTTLNEAAIPDTYDGPMLFEGDAATELFLQGGIDRLGALKLPVSSASDVHVEANPWQSRIGARVLPDFLNVTDDPTMREMAGQPLLATARVDDDAVPTRAVKIIEAGRLKMLLADRVPSPGARGSTGSRRGGGPMPSNLVITAEGGLDSAALRARLVGLARERGREFGVVLRGLLPEILAAKVFADGHEEPLRNVELGEISPESLKDIVAAGREPHVEHLFMTVHRPAADPSNEMVSLVAPALLLEEVTLKPQEGGTAQPPVLGHPFFVRP
jgi:predicted Zn-dependent protease